MTITKQFGLATVPAPVLVGRLEAHIAVAMAALLERRK